MAAFFYLIDLFIRFDNYDEENMELKDRITLNHRIMGGVPCIRNLRMPISTILALLAEGYDEKKLLEEHEELEPEDIRAVLKYASDYFRTKEFPLAV
jgi:uncharacterized protein (DUF433 family)